jgi:hypothetical protein
MGIVDRLFGKKQHGRRGSEEDDTDPASYTRIIGSEGPPAPAADSDPWGDPAPAEPPPAPVADDEPTRAPMAPASPPPVAPSPQVREPLPRDLSPSGPGDDATVLGPVSEVRGPSRVVAVLVCVEGPLDSHVVRLFEGDNVLGREGSPESLPNGPETKTISRQHARLRADGGDFMIEPMRPENATFVNDLLIETPQLVSHGDRIRLGASKPSTFALLVVP